jgi:transposase
VAGWREARGLAKSNKKDADLLSELWGEPATVRGGVLERWWEVWCPPAEVRDQREWLRYRMALVRMQTSMKNQIHATLHRHGLVQPFSDLFGVAGRKWLLEICQDDSSGMSQGGRRTLQGRLTLLVQLRRQIASATRQFHAVIRRCPEVRRLTTLPGVSTVLGYTIASEIGRLERFRSGRDLASYSLLTPISADSGDEREGPPIGRHVGKAGRRTLKWAWIEAARSAVRKSARMKKVFDRYTENGKYNRGRGHIVVAHQMCLIGYAMWKNQTPYQEAPPLRPGMKPAENQPSADEFSALDASSSEGEERKAVEAGKGRMSRNCADSELITLKEPDEQGRSKRLKKGSLVRERTSPKSDMAAQASASV